MIHFFIISYEGHYNNSVLLYNAVIDELIKYTHLNHIIKLNDVFKQKSETVNSKKKDIPAKDAYNTLSEEKAKLLNEILLNLNIQNYEIKSTSNEIKISLNDKDLNFKIFLLPVHHNINYFRKTKYFKVIYSKECNDINLVRHFTDLLESKEGSFLGK